MVSAIFEQIVNGIVSGSVYAIVAVGMTMIFGVLRAINFAHGEYYMLGTFGAWFAIEYFDLPYPVAIVIGVIADRGHRRRRRQVRDAAHRGRAAGNRGAGDARHRAGAAKYRDPRLRRRLQVLLRRLHRAGLDLRLHAGRAARPDHHRLPSGLRRAGIDGHLQPHGQGHARGVAEHRVLRGGRYRRAAGGASDIHSRRLPGGVCPAC